MIGLVASIIRQLLVLQMISSPQFAKMACGYRAVMALINNHKTTLSMRLKEIHVTVPSSKCRFLLECHYTNWHGATSVQKMATPSTGFKWALQPLVLSTETN